MKIALKKKLLLKLHKRNFHSAEEEDLVIFQEKLAEDLLLQLHLSMPNNQLTSILLLVFFQPVWELMEISQRQTAPIEELQFAMVKGLTV